jgi:hypothetical protein
LNFEKANARRRKPAKKGKIRSQLANGRAEDQLILCQFDSPSHHDQWQRRIAAPRTRKIAAYLKPSLEFSRGQWPWRFWVSEKDLGISAGSRRVMGGFSKECRDSKNLHLELFRTLGIMIPVTIVPLVLDSTIARTRV